MSAELLRRAAALMRERATDALNEWGIDRWRVHQCEFNDPDIRDTYKRNPDWMKNHVATDDVHGSVLLVSPWQEIGVATHAASWHPAVALAVADWLEAVAHHIDKRWTSTGDAVGKSALAVARAYLGEAADD